MLTAPRASQKEISQPIPEGRGIKPAGHFSVEKRHRRENTLPERLPSAGPAYKIVTKIRPIPSSSRALWLSLQRPA
jgi:hypothetical protein